MVWASGLVSLYAFDFILFVSCCVFCLSIGCIVWLGYIDQYGQQLVKFCSACMAIGYIVWLRCIDQYVTHLVKLVQPIN